MTRPRAASRRSSRCGPGPISRNAPSTGWRSALPPCCRRTERRGCAMVDEYLSEREQAEQLRHWLRENWIWLFAGVALTLGGYYGYQWWDARQSSRSLAAEQRFAAMLDALGRNQRDEGVRIGGELTGEFAGTPYADQAALVLARL